MPNLISIVGCITKVRGRKNHTLITICNQTTTIEVEVPDNILDTEQPLAPQNYVQVTGTLTTYLHDRCYSHRMTVKAASIQLPSLPFDPTLLVAELLTTALCEVEK